jgi:hypothetical protein
MKIFGFVAIAGRRLMKTINPCYPMTAWTGVDPVFTAVDHGPAPAKLLA